MEKIKSGKRRKNKKETPPSSSEEKLQECPVCFTQQSLIGFNSCEHRACVSCLQNYLQIEISEGRVDLRCPVCSESLWPVDLHRILGDAHPLLSKYEEFAVRRALAMDPDTRWCPTPDCGFAVIAAGCASCPRLKCQRPGCVTEFCYHCKQLWHPNQTCDIARMQRAPRAASISSQCSHHEEMKFCPRCQAPIMKLNDGSCNHMTCPVCGCEFCWLCMKEVSDLHYLSPSGCTFWGKKPWSRKKKLLWQLGTLVGAPLGITLMAGVAVPALIVGLPIWVGRKLYNKYAKKRRALRNAYIAGGVFGSVLISPLVAAVTVGLGVPILLAYVYGVIPVSLCRNSACVRSDSESSDVVPMETLKDTTPEALVEAALEAITRRDPSAWNAFRETEVTITIDPSTGKTEAQIHHELSESDVPSSSGLCHVETC